MRRISEDQLYELLTESENIELDSDIKITEPFTQNIKEFFGHSDIFPIDTFSGSLDGNGYCIENPPLELINRLTGKIKNLTIKFTKSVSAENAKYILCRFNKGLIENVSFDTVYQIPVSGAIRTNDNVIDNCQSNISLEYTPYFSGGICTKNNNIIQNCSFDGSIAGLQNVGGIAGRNSGEILNCTVSGEVSGEDSVGGIAGRNNNKIQNCTTSGLDISASEQYLGGIAGLNCGVIQQCYCGDKTQIEGVKFTGGIAGKNVDEIEYCETEETVEVSAEFTVGGLVGRNESEIRKSISRTSVSGDDNIGGISGRVMDSSTIVNSMSRGTITAFANGGLLFGDIESNSNIKNCHYFGEPSNKSLIGDSKQNDDIYNNSELNENEICSILMLD